MILFAFFLFINIILIIGIIYLFQDQKRNRNLNKWLSYYKSKSLSQQLTFNNMVQELSLIKDENYELRLEGNTQKKQLDLYKRNKKRRNRVLDKIGRIKLVEKNIEDTYILEFQLVQNNINK